MGRYGVTQVQLAPVLGLTQSALSKRLRCAPAFDMDELDIIADLFGVTVSQLLDGVPPGAPRPPTLNLLRARRDSNPQPSDPKVRPFWVAA